MHLAVEFEGAEASDFLLQRDPPRTRRLKKGVLALLASVPQLVLASFVHVSDGRIKSSLKCHLLTFTPFTLLDSIYTKQWVTFPFFACFLKQHMISNSRRRTPLLSALAVSLEEEPNPRNPPLQHFWSSAGLVICSHKNEHSKRGIGGPFTSTRLVTNFSQEQRCFGSLIPGVELCRRSSRRRTRLLI
jgi:hypothetical protein